MEKEYDVLVKDSEKKMKIRPEEIVIGEQTIFLKELITYSVNKKEGMIILEYGNENNSEMIIINLKDLKGKKAEDIYKLIDKNVSKIKVANEFDCKSKLNFLAEPEGENELYTAEF